MHSQNYEELIVLEYFNSKSGTLLSLGENDGVTLSNSFALIEQGWSGTLVDASPKAFAQLKELHGNNPNLVLLNYAVGSENGFATFYESGELLGMGDTALVSSLKLEETKRWGSIKMPFEEKRVEVIDFEKLLSLTHFEKYDYITIDIEGAEIEVVPQIDFKKLGTKLAIIEWNSKYAEFYDNIMFPFGFKLIHTNAENRIYAL